MKDPSIVTSWCLPNNRIEQVKSRALAASGCSYLRIIKADATHSTIFFRWQTLEHLDAFTEKLLTDLYSG